ncbi:ion transporter [Aliiroseovarius crassostreae]|uniref:ion transporter n=1 Tax=Aliiroseovarius crassostreae TaxID=154981 RepID=UPI0021FC219E|nr:ion transporter [Aliiroseovarius crassostreae]UWQ08421.1 ion transporter [Aliiroseovarius crassostreae]UWQ11520.1 ion transporter [Aliiroseovarius crassostreae]
MKRQEVIDILDGSHPTFGGIVARGMDALILLSAVAIALETEPGLPKSLRHVLFGFEVLVLGIFTAEYVLRVICTRPRLRYIFSFWGLVDLLTILPAIALLTPQWQAVRIFRLLRLVRLVKLFRGSHAMERLATAFQEVRGELAIFGIIAGLMLYVASVGIYIFEHDAQPEVFSSIPQSLWWAVASFTTVGYGDMVPITAGGRVFTTFVLFLGLGVIAVPSAIITTALLEADTNIQKKLANSASEADKENQSKTAQSTKGE